MNQIQNKTALDIIMEQLDIYEAEAEEIEEPDTIDTLDDEHTIEELGVCPEWDATQLRWLFASVVNKAIQDYTLLDPYDTERSLSGQSPKYLFHTAKLFLFHNEPAMGNLGITFDEVCDILEISPDRVRSHCEERRTQHGNYQAPTGYQFDLFQEDPYCISTLCTEKDQDGQEESREDRGTCNITTGSS